MIDGPHGFIDGRALRVLFVSTRDVGGGAENSAWNLFDTYRKRGLKSRLAVGTKRTDDPHVLIVPNETQRSSWARFWIRASNGLELVRKQLPRLSQLQSLCHCIGEPRRWLERKRGYEDFNYPGAWKLLELAESPDIVHCYNLHEQYFDLRVLPWLTQKKPVILDLRDAWLLSGHCAHSFGCDRWKTGCGQCPDLTLYPSISRDGTAYNWQRKREIFARSRFYVAAPSRWLMQKVHESMLAPAIIESRVIPTGIDLSIFHRSDKRQIRSQLQIPQNAKVLLFAAIGVRRNIWKDFATMREAVRMCSERFHERESLLFIALGEDSPPEQIGEARIRFVPHVNNPSDVAAYYQAADLYLHAATADTFPRAVLEALACGTPVVATTVGGIPEQIRNLECAGSNNADGATGILVRPADAHEMAHAIERLLSNDVLRQMLSENATRDVRKRFDLAKQADRYLHWYREILQSHNAETRHKIVNKTN
jgi:glycosyltransferase involved in cell wall biosynthesis